MIPIVLLSLIGVAATADSTCGSHSNSEIYPVSDDACLTYYYECISGVETKRDCAPSLVYNPQLHTCDWPSNVPTCTTAGISGCTDANGNSIDGLSYTQTSDCSEGYYYKCVSGIANPMKCPDGETFDVSMQMCRISSTFPNCESQSVDKPDGDESAGSISETTTTIASAGTAPPMTGTTNAPPMTGTTNAPPMTGTNTAPPMTGNITASTTTTTTTKEATTTTTTTKAAEPVVSGDTYVGFVVDDTGSMSVEITAVKQWIEDCVTGDPSSNCGDEPTGGWLTVSFNDPYTGDVVGPTLDSQVIIDEIAGYTAHNGGDCPEMAMSGIEKLAAQVPDGNAGCKIFLFTDATPKDANDFNDADFLLQSKGCAFTPILTGCCGPCPPVCDSTDPQYCTNNVVDTSTTSYRSLESGSTYSTSANTAFYSLSEATGGTIYITDKPSTPDEMLDFLDEEVTLGFCPSTDIAGPSPDGYKCEADCQIMGMCWDKSVSKCYCNETCVYSPIPYGYSHCDGAQHVECDPDVAIEVIPDMSDCTGYFECASGELFHFTCANGTVYSEASSSYCDHPEDVPPPCGTETNVVTP